MRLHFQNVCTYIPILFYSLKYYKNEGINNHNHNNNNNQNDDDLPPFEELVKNT